jgi:hypothetical protein
MRPWWRRLAERADKCAFSEDEVAEALVPALEAECRKELPAPVLEGLRNALNEPGLFGPTEAPHLGTLSAQVPNGLARRVFDNIAILTPAETADLNCFQRALENAIHGEAGRYFRQIEEHYRRNASARRAQRERDRLHTALNRADVSGLAQRLLRPDGTRPSTRIAPKTGLDDGVRLK